MKNSEFNNSKRTSSIGMLYLYTFLTFGFVFFGVWSCDNKPAAEPKKENIITDFPENTNNEINNIKDTDILKGYFQNDTLKLYLAEFGNDEIKPDYIIEILENNKVIIRCENAGKIEYIRTDLDSIEETILKDNL